MRIILLRMLSIVLPEQYNFYGHEESHLQVRSQAQTSGLINVMIGLSPTYILM